MTAEERRTSRDRWLLPSLLGGGTAYFVLFLVVHAVIAFTAEGVAVVDVVCLVLVGLPQWWLIRRPFGRLGTGRTVATALLLVAAATVGLTSIAGVAFPDGYDAWFLGAIAFDLLGLTVVGRFGAAWLTMLVVVLACLAWAVLDGRPLAVGAGMIVRHVATLAVGTALAASLRRSTAASAAFHAVQRRRRTEEDVARARAGARRSAVEQVLEQAGPLLRSIADGEPLSAEDRSRMLVVEGSLRDQIRNPRLTESRLPLVVDAARSRGVNVLLLDEADAAPDGVRSQALRWLAEQLDRTAEGRFVGRLRDLDGDGVRVSAVRDDDGESAVFRSPAG